MKSKRIIDNRTPMVVRYLPTDDPQGRQIGVVIAKMTWQVSTSGAISIASPPSPIRFSDVRIAQHPSSSIRYPSDYVDQKPGTDILVVGTAYPQKNDATEQDVSLLIEARHGSIKKTIRVLGPRVWTSSMTGVVPGPPARLSPTPLIYELAYGGQDDTDPNHVVTETRNPVGIGFSTRRSRLVGKTVPQLEDPQAPLSSNTPAPAGFGPIARTWSPRHKFMGTCDEVWQRQRAPVRPLDFNPRYNCSAPEGLWSETPLLGDEPVTTLALTPNGLWRFQLPAYTPVFQSIIRGQSSFHSTHLDTFLIDADPGRIELTFRTQIPLPRNPEQLESVCVFGSPPLSEALKQDLAARVYGHLAKDAS